MIAPDPDDPDIVYGGRVDKLDLRTGQTRSIDPTLARRPISIGARGRCRWCFPSAIRSGFISATRNSSARSDGGAALGCDQPRSHARESRRAAECRRGHRGEQRAAGTAPRRHLHDRAIAARCATALGRHRRWARLAHARRRRALGQRHAGCARRVVEGRHHRRLAFRCRTPPTPRSTAIGSTIASRTSIARTTAERSWQLIVAGIRDGDFVNAVREDPQTQRPALRRDRARHVRLVRRRRSLAVAAGEPAAHVGARHRRARRRSRHRHARPRLLDHGRRHRRCGSSTRARRAWTCASMRLRPRSARASRRSPARRCRRTSRSRAIRRAAR